jgi:hydroxyquinol 1,2-dioxygenase
MRNLDQHAVTESALERISECPNPRLKEMNLRARFRSDAEGEYKFMSVKPSSYPVPSDGPVGKMLNALGRHPFRPAHIHFIISAPGFKPLVTALYIDGDRYIDSDVVFGSREQLVVKYQPSRSANVDSIEYNFVVESENAR